MSAHTSDEEHPVWARYLVMALTWAIPALLILPIYLIVLAISMLGGDGALLEATEELPVRASYVCGIGRIGDVHDRPRDIGG